jgi:hypothetical protein
MVSDQDFQQVRERLAKLEEEFAIFRKQSGFAGAAVPASDEDARIIAQIKKPDMMAAIKIHQEIHHSSMVEAQQDVRELMQRLNKK